MIGTLVDLLGSFYASNDLINFEAMARSLHAAIPGDQMSLQFLGLVYYRTGRIKDAKSLFDKLRLRRAASNDIDDIAASGEPAIPDDPATLACYQEATRQRPYLARAWYDLGSILMELGRFEQAVAVFRNSLKADPANAKVLLAMGQAGLRANDLVAAHDGFSGLRRMQTDNPAAYRGLGLIFRKQHKYSTARAFFSCVRDLAPRVTNS